MNATQTQGKIIVIDDDLEMRSLLQDFFRKKEMTVTTFGKASEAFEALRPGGPLALGTEVGDIDLVISDINMPDMTGLEFAAQAKRFRPEIPVILITAFGSIETAIEAMKQGAYHYVVKPFKLAELSVNVDRALDFRRAQKDLQVLRDQINGSFALGDVVGKSPAMRTVFDLVERVSQASTNILITGESGTGKEMVARAIHKRGPRKDRPFIAINCTAIPESLLESELFGHAKGAFTGAITRKRGLFEEAEKGTLFLDEIGDMPMSLQSKLLRVIQERKIRAVGENADRDIDLRVIAATHKDLKAAIKEGRFREDLFYRLSVIPIVLPALRERADDIPRLATHFLRKYAAQNGSRVNGFTPRAMQRLVSLRWEGNVRELENVVERAVVLANQSLIDENDIPTPEGVKPDEFFNTATQDFPTITQLEKRYMALVLEKTAGRKDKAAQILGINRRTLYRKEREFGFVEAGNDSDETSLGGDEPGDSQTG